MRSRGYCPSPAPRANPQAPRSPHKGDFLIVQSGEDTPDGGIAIVVGAEGEETLGKCYRLRDDLYRVERLDLINREVPWIVRGADIPYNVLGLMRAYPVPTFAKSRTAVIH